jgi:hypothetical protein
MKGYVFNYKVISKIRKTQHQKLKFGHTQGEFFLKKLAKKYINIQQRMKLNKPSLLVVN